MSDPVTNSTRPVTALLSQAADACTQAGVPGRVYTGTTYKGLAQVIPTILAESKGSPAAVVCYGGSVYANSPRRTSAIIILVVQGHTRVAPGTLTALEAANSITASLDDTITEDIAGEYPITDKWRQTSEDVVDLEGLDSAACIMLTFNVEDY